MIKKELRTRGGNRARRAANGRRHRLRVRRPLRLEWLERRELLTTGLCPSVPLSLVAEVEPNDSLATATPLDPATARVDGALSLGDRDFFAICDSSANFRLVARVQADGFDTRLSLLDRDGKLLIQSEGTSVLRDGRPEIDLDDRIAQHLRGDRGPYFLRVESVGGLGGRYSLTTETQAALPPFQPLPVEKKPSAVVPAQLNDDNGDGRIDKADILDLAVSNNESDSVSILLGLGDGTFRSHAVVQVGESPEGLAIGDLDNDSFLDLVTVNESADSVSILYGIGDGRFQTRPGPPRDILIGAQKRPSSIVLAQLSDDDGDGRITDKDWLDIAVGNEASGEEHPVAIVLQTDRGKFEKAIGHTSDDSKPQGLVSVDFDLDGRPDLAIANESSSTVSLLFTPLKGLSSSDASVNSAALFSEKTFATLGEERNDDGELEGLEPKVIAVGHFSDDDDKTYGSPGDFPDLVVGFKEAIWLFINPGRFRDPRADDVIEKFKLSDIEPEALVVVQLNDDNGDGRIDDRDLPDLAVADEKRQKIAVLTGRLKKGRFTLERHPQEPALAGTPESLAAGDFNGDGRPDLVTGLSDLDVLTPLFGFGDGTFSPGVGLTSGGTQPAFVLATDFNGDGLPDLATGNKGSKDVGIQLGRGDGTFDLPSLRKFGKDVPESLSTADANGDGRVDFVVGFQNDLKLASLLGLGDGLFVPPKDVATNAKSPNQAGEDPQAIATGDFNGDKRVDLAIANKDSKNVSILFGRETGFADIGRSFSVAGKPVAIVAADLDGDGNLDLATRNDAENKEGVSILFGKGQGDFEKAVGCPFCKLTETDGNGAITHLVTASGQNFLAVVDGVSSSISLISVNVRRELLPDGSVKITRELLPDGNAIHLGEKFNPNSIIPGDFNRDGWIDLAVVADQDQDRIAVLLQSAGDTYPKVGEMIQVGEAPVAIVTADFDGDGIVDLVTANRAAESVSFIKGIGNGLFPSERTDSAVEDNPDSLAVGDFNGDGKLDLVSANRAANTAVVLFGSGDGRFQRDELKSPAKPVGDRPNAIVAVDFNIDTQLDVVVANRGSDVSILEGIGGGRFRDEDRLVLADQPEPFAVGDFDRDGHPDLATASILTGEITLVFGSSNGFGSPLVIPSGGAAPQALVAGHFNDDNGDGLRNEQDRLDLVVAHRSDDSLKLLVQTTGCGRRACFNTALRPIDVEDKPVAMATAQFTDDNGDGQIDDRDFLDLAVTSLTTGNVSILFGRSDGSFQAANKIPTGGSEPVAVVAAQLTDDNGDGQIDEGDWTDLVTANRASENVSVLLGQRDGTFVFKTSIPVGRRPESITVADWNGDGRPDLATSNFGSSDLSILIGLGDGRFVSQNAGAFSSKLIAQPLFDDLDGDGLQDAIILDRSGNILFRRRLNDAELAARSGVRQIGVFAPPIVLNPASPARDVAVITRGGGERMVAAIDRRSESISFFDLARVGGVLVPDQMAGPDLPPTSLPTELEAADLNGDGRDDLVVSLRGVDQVAVLIATDRGWTRLENADGFSVGSGSSGVRLGDVNGDGFHDILVAGQVSGDVTFFASAGGTGAGFLPGVRVRSGTGLRGLGSETAATSGVTSREQADSLVVGDFNRDGRADLLAISRGSRSVGLLLGKESGGFADAFPVIENIRANAIAVSQLTDDNGDGLRNELDALDVILVDQEQSRILVFTGRGDGTFLPKSSFNVTTATDVAMLDLIGRDMQPDGLVDLVVGNEFGDLLLLVGRGDGTFVENPSERAVVLDVADLTGDGINEFAFADRGVNEVFVNDSNQLNTQLISLSEFQTPSDLRVADVNNDRKADLVVVNTGKNNLEVFLGNGDRTFQSPVSQSTGTRPVGVTVAHLDTDGVLDYVVANESSNDLTILRGLVDGKSLKLERGPRLRAGRGPVASLVEDVTGPAGKPDGIPDILVANSSSNDVYLLRGLGNGFFADATPRVYPTGKTPLDVFVGDFNFDGRSDLVTINFDSDDITFFSNFTAPGAEASGVAVPTGGDGPIAAILDGRRRSLLIANHRDGIFSQLSPLAGIPSVIPLFRNPFVPHPTSVDSGSPEVYGVTAGGRRAELLFRFNDQFTGQVIGGAPIRSFTLPVSETSSLVLSAQRSVGLSALSSSGIPIVPTLETTFTLSIQDAPEEKASDKPIDGIANPEENPEADEDRSLPDRFRTPLRNFIFGLDEALEQFLRELRERPGRAESASPGQPAPPSSGERREAGKPAVPAEDEPASDNERNLPPQSPVQESGDSGPASPEDGSVLPERQSQRTGSGSFFGSELTGIAAASPKKEPDPFYFTRRTGSPRPDVLDSDYAASWLQWLQLVVPFGLIYSKRRH